MSDTQQGPGWWLASDGKWYPPESHPAQQAPPTVPPPGPGHQVPAPAFLPPTPPPGPYAPPPSSYGAPPPGSPPWGTAYAPYGGGPPGTTFPGERRTNGLAIASFVCAVGGIVPFFFGLSCVAAIVLGFISLGQIKRTNGVQQGRGLAIAGIVIGFSLIAIFVAIVGIAIGTAHHNQFR